MNREDQFSLDRLFNEHGDWLRRFSRRSLRLQPADADDIVQETYLRLARNQTEVSRPRALLARVALNLFRDGMRRRDVRDQHRRSELQTAPVPPQDMLAEQEVTLEIERLVLALPEPLRDVFVLSRFRHMSNRAIADHLGVSIKTVEWRMSRALDFCAGRLRD